MGEIGIIVVIVISNILQTIIVLNAIDNFKVVLRSADRSGETKIDKSV